MAAQNRIFVFRTEVSEQRVIKGYRILNYLGRRNDLKVLPKRNKKPRFIPIQEYEALLGYPSSVGIGAWLPHFFLHGSLEYPLTGKGLRIRWLLHCSLPFPSPVYAFSQSTTSTTYTSSILFSLTQLFTFFSLLVFTCFSKRTQVPSRIFGRRPRRIHITMADTTTTATTDRSTTPIPSFVGFSDFDLDLSCLSPETSPNNSQTGIRPLTSAESTPRSSRTPSFFSQANFGGDSRPAKKMSPTLMMSPSVATTVIRGSWPLIRYVGRGTPVDKTRRVEWGAVGGEEVTEDGLLFSPVRSASLDSVTRRPASREWNFSLGASTSQPTLKAHDHGFLRSKSKFFDQPPPELAPISISADNSDDWSSLMHKVLRPSTPVDEKGKTADEAALPEMNDPEAKILRTEEVKDHNGEENIKSTESGQSAVRMEGAMTPEEIRQLDMELGNNLGLNEALNLGLSLRGDGMNLFNIGIIPSSGQDTPSVYPSDEGASRTSRPPSVHVIEATSYASLGTRTDDCDPIPVHGTKNKARSWWSRFVKSFRKVPGVLHLHSPKQR